MSEIKNIIFDFGAVLYDIDFNKAALAFQKIGIPDFNHQYTQSQVSETFSLLEKGKISPDAFLVEMQSQSQNNVTTNEVKEAWNSILLDFRKESISWMIQNRSKYRFFLLSNTNIIHYQYFTEQFKDAYPGLILENLFEKAFFSFEIGMRKPDEAIFNHVLKETNLIPEETLFIDDTGIHIETAKSIGLQCHHLLPFERIETLGKI